MQSESGRMENVILSSPGRRTICEVPLRLKVVVAERLNHQWCYGLFPTCSIWGCVDTSKLPQVSANILSWLCCIQLLRLFELWLVTSSLSYHGWDVALREEVSEPYCTPNVGGRLRILHGGRSLLLWERRDRSEEGFGERAVSCKIRGGDCVYSWKSRIDLLFYIGISMFQN